MLQKINPVRSKNIDPKNKRRLIRAIEIAQLGFESKMPKLGGRAAKLSNYNTLYMGITRQTEVLKKRIEKRLIERLEQGMIKEVKNLRHKKNLSWKRLDELGLEYRYISYFLRGKIKSEKELFEKLKIEIWRYAKRQTTWFRRNKDIHWIKNEKEAEKFVKNFLS